MKYYHVTGDHLPLSRHFIGNAEDTNKYVCKMIQEIVNTEDTRKPVLYVQSWGGRNMKNPGHYIRIAEYGDDGHYVRQVFYTPEKRIIKGGINF
jgi:hypothetical protein